MFREIRRKKQMLSNDECIEILNKGTSGVLALLGDNNYPYTVPISYIYCNSKLYFHGAKSGHKIDAIKKYSKASFCVIDQDNIIPEEYTTYFRSVVAFGNIHIMKNEIEIKKAIEDLAKKYYPNDSEVRRNIEIDKEWKSLCMMEFSIEYLSGKEAIEITVPDIFIPYSKFSICTSLQFFNKPNEENAKIKRKVCTNFPFDFGCIICINAFKKINNLLIETSLVVYILSNLISDIYPLFLPAD